MEERRAVLAVKVGSRSPRRSAVAEANLREEGEAGKRDASPVERLEVLAVKVGSRSPRRSAAAAESSREQQAAESEASPDESREALAGGVSASASSSARPRARRMDSGGAPSASRAEFPGVLAAGMVRRTRETHRGGSATPHRLLRRAK